MPIPADGDASADDALVDGWVRRGDEECFRELYRRHTPALYRLAAGLVDRDEDAEDVIQEVWVRASRRMSGFGRRSTLRTWLCGITLNCCREWRRKAGRRAPLPDHPVAAAGADRAAAIDIFRQLAALPARAREVLILHGVAGYSHEEVGAILGISGGTSKSELSYARKLMRQAHERSKGEVIHDE